jgi:glutathione S-transferase
MTNPSQVVLRYFNIRGRGQALRDALTDADVPFVDERIEIGPAWGKLKEQAGGGPFGSLPVLEWGDDRVGQTLAIASYLGRRLGHYDGLDAGSIARLEMVSSAAYLDVSGQTALMMRPPAPLNDENEAPYFTGYQSNAEHKLERIERILAARDDRFFGGNRPVVTDFFVFEAIEAQLLLFGARFEVWLKSHPRLGAFRSEVAARPRLARFFAAGGRVDRITGSPHEAAVRDRLRHFLARESGS